MKEETKKIIRDFIDERNWDQFHTPGNLAKSISIEAGELLECFQWNDTEYDLNHVAEEIADVMVLLKQFQLYYDISTEEIKSIIEAKDRAMAGKTLPPQGLFLVSVNYER